MAEATLVSKYPILSMVPGLEIVGLVKRRTAVRCAVAIPFRRVPDLISPGPESPWQVWSGRQGDTVW